MKSFEVKVVDNSRIFLDALPPQIEAALEAVGNQIVGYAIDILTAKIPRHSDSWYVSKGASGLKGSINHRVVMSEKAVYIGTNNEHAIYNEVGTGIYAEGGRGRQSPWVYKGEDGKFHRTRGISALHFLRDACEKHIDEIKQIIIEYLSR